MLDVFKGIINHRSGFEVLLNQEVAHEFERFDASVGGGGDLRSPNDILIVGRPNVAHHEVVPVEILTAFVGHHVLPYAPASVVVLQVVGDSVGTVGVDLRRQQRK